MKKNWMIGLAVLLILLAVGATPLPGRLVSRFFERIADRPVLSALLMDGALLLLLLLCAAYIVSSTYNPFLYFRF